MKFTHQLMNNNYTNKDISAVKKFLKNKDVILTQSTKVQEFEKKLVKMVRSKIFNFCEFWLISEFYNNFNFKSDEQK